MADADASSGGEGSPALIGILTVSDRASRGEYEDRGGPAIRAYLERVLTSPWRAVAEVVSDEQSEVERAIRQLAAAAAGPRVTAARAPTTISRTCEPRASRTTRSIWDIGAVTALFALSNRYANLAGIRRNDEFYGTAR